MLCEAFILRLPIPARADFAPSLQVWRIVWRHQCRLEARRRLVQVHVFGSYAYVLPDVIAFGRYFPAIKGCIEYLMAMVDVNKVFPDKKPQEWAAIMNTPDKHGWYPLIKPPPDTLVWRPVLIFLSVFIISFRSSNTLLLLIRWRRPSMMHNPPLRPSLR
jgi:hypothetical protein